MIRRIEIQIGIKATIRIRNMTELKILKRGAGIEDYC